MDVGAASATPTGGAAASYHRAELSIAMSRDDRRRLQPALPERFTSILDIGCGAGQTLVGCGLGEHVEAWGVDLDADALALGRSLAPRVRFVRAPGERLPFRDRSFDVVISRVALPYMNIPMVIEEVARVLKPGGHFWFALHPRAMYTRRLVSSMQAGNVKDVLYSSYVLLNGLLLHWAGMQVRFPLNRQRCESFQTVSGMARALRRRGFEVASAAGEPSFVMTAILPRAAHPAP